MSNKINIIGQKFSRLTVVNECNERRNKKIFWQCKCDCGKYVDVVSQHLRTGATRSCGCLFTEEHTKRITTHGLTKRGNKKPSEYIIWSGMISRCTNTKEERYKDYGGRGIMVCNRWLHSFENFFADMGQKPTELHSIDRINTNGNYEPGNCRWATDIEQARNKRNNIVIEHNNQTLVLSDWAQILNANPASIKYMLKTFSFNDIHNFFTDRNGFKTIKMWKRENKLTA